MDPNKNQDSKFQDIYNEKGRKFNKDEVPNEPPPSYSEAIGNLPYQNVSYSIPRPSAPILDEPQSNNVQTGSSFIPGQYAQPVESVPLPIGFEQWDDKATRVLITNRLQLNDQFNQTKTVEEREILWNRILNELLLAGYPYFSIFDLIRFWEFQFYIYLNILNGLTNYHTTNWQYFEPMHNVFIHQNNLDILDVTSNSSSLVNPVIDPVPHIVSVETNNTLQDNTSPAGGLLSTAADTEKQITIHQSSEFQPLNSSNEVATSISDQLPLISSNEIAVSSPEILPSISPNEIVTSSFTPATLPKIVSDSNTVLSEHTSLIHNGDSSIISSAAQASSVNANNLAYINDTTALPEMVSPVNSVNLGEAVTTQTESSLSVTKLLDDSVVTIQPSGSFVPLDTTSAPTIVYGNAGVNQEGSGDCCICCIPTPHSTMHSSGNHVDHSGCCDGDTGCCDCNGGDDCCIGDCADCFDCGDCIGAIDCGDCVVC